MYTPFIAFTTAQIILRGNALRVDYGLTLSRYAPLPFLDACGSCAPCQLRLKGFREAGVQDTARYLVG
ncbi:7-cyano-7-deazaguanine synthase [Hyalangium sp. s54d21]|uniref:7-cyano-7-deazaguanine synthase n=1 Tax=Hyalangium rubrum TaxID=3103134 RepID=A0ABU5HEG0_9BACT|nr:7-cyano-7-deazaguanine synthase [Hyalangium sp. s54d21]MDY7231532.1 7-cyano-7-deazaguanine synthase [Hyalangium sp. s54d21]